MPSLAAISKIDFPFKANQQDVKELARNLFSPSFPDAEKMLGVFSNAEIETRNLCKPLDYYSGAHGFRERNAEYIRIALEYATIAVEECISSAQVRKEDVTDIIFVSTTGLATPSLDALIVNKIRLNQYINRMPVFGLGCGGGTAGCARACTLAKANPKAAVLLVCVELCSLTFLRNDFSKSNFVGSSLFSDGVAACLIVGDDHVNKGDSRVRFLASESKLYFDSLDAMGWDFTDNGFKILFSPDIPDLIAGSVNADVASFLSRNRTKLSDIKNFIFHPGGRKVLSAMEEALGIGSDRLETTRSTLSDYGNMSSATVLYVLERFLVRGFENGYGLMVAMGPGFSCDMLLLGMEKR